MTLVATVVDPVTEPAPPDWDEFAVARRLLPGWHSQPMRTIDWCMSTPSSMVVVRDGSTPVALFHARHLGLVNLARFAPVGSVPRVSLTECRTASVPMEAGLAFAADTDRRDRIEAIRTFERAVGRHAGPGGLGIVYRFLLAEHLPVVPAGGRVLLPISPRMVVRNEWPDLASYLASRPAKWRSQLKKLHQEVRADPGIRVELAEEIDPAQACWLHDVVRRRYAQRLVPSPSFPERLMVELGRLPGFRFLTYRDAGDRLIGYSAVYDSGTDLVLIWWGSRAPGDGWRPNLYFDQYLRLVELMIDLGRSRLFLGAGMEHIKARYGARPEPRWAVIGLAVPGGGAARRRRAAASPAVASRTPDGPTAGPVPGDAPEPGWWGDSLVRWVLRRLSRRPGRRPGTTTACWQCGGSGSVHPLRRGGRAAGRARYWCQRCGAVVSQREAVVPREPVVPREAVAPREPVVPREPVAPDPPDAAGEPDLPEFMPPAMLRWARERSRRPLRSGRLDKSTMYQLYRNWDTHLQRIGPAAAIALARPGELPPCPGLPAFSRVVGALHDGCYRTGEVVAQLRPPPEVPTEALRQRVEHARRWLAGPGIALCWIHSRLPPGGPAAPDRPAVEAAAAALRRGEVPDQAGGHAARAALFGTVGGPALATLLRTYPAREMVAALEAYLATGARPLRDEVLTRLRW